MATFSIEAAQAELDELIDRSKAGEDIFSQTGCGGLVRLAALTPEQIAEIERRSTE